jgi:acyl carrier protein
MQTIQIETIQQDITDLIKANASSEVSIELETNFVKSGILDSFAILSMVMQIEQVFKIKFTIDELANTQLQTVSGLASAVANKLV